MELAVKRFARNVLLLHFGLLIVILTIVFLASKGVYQSAREQAVRQALSRQELLASQIARGVEEFYQSIASDLDLLPRADSLADEAALISGLTGGRSHASLKVNGKLNLKKAAADDLARLNSARRNALGPLLTRQLEERVDFLFIYEKKRQVAIDISRGDDGDAIIDSTGPEKAIVEAYSDFLREVELPTVSPFKMVDDYGVNLVVHPLPKLSAVIVAVVSVEKVSQQYVKPLHEGSSTDALLINARATAIMASREGLIGQNLPTVADPLARDAFNTFEAHQSQGKQVLLTVEPVRVEGRRWSILVSSPLADVDSVVGRLYRQVLVGGIVVSMVLGAILVSTTVQLIGSRAKMERTRHEGLRRELDKARQIQQAWLPQSLPKGLWLDIYAVNYPAQHISGDFYNWFELPGGRIAVVIGDVTGHGMSAAFLMATTQLLVRTTMVRVDTPSQCLEEVNRQLCTQTFNGQFVTMQLLVLDPEHQTVEFATAGHPAPLVAEGDGALPSVLPVEPQLVLGVDGDATYQTERFHLSPGSTLVLYTDGALDVQAPDGDRLGEPGLRKAIGKAIDADGSLNAAALTHRGSASRTRSLLDAVVRGVNAFRGNRALGDDLTLVALRINTGFQPQTNANAAEAAIA